MERKWICSRARHVNLTWRTCEHFQCTRIIFLQLHPFCISTIYLLTHSMVQSPSWEANWFAASQEIPRILWSPKVHYRTHKRPPPVSILGQSNPVHIPTSHLLEIRPNIIHPSTRRSTQWYLSLRFPHQDPISPPLLTHTHAGTKFGFWQWKNTGWGCWGGTAE